MKAKWEAAAVIIENEAGQVLLLKRGPTALWMPNKWNLPGGILDPGEVPMQTAVREAKEEASLILPSNLEFVDRVEIEGGFVSIFHTNCFEGSVQLDWESSEYLWAAKIDGFELVPGIGNALRDCLEGREQ